LHLFTPASFFWKRFPTYSKHDPFDPKTTQLDFSFTGIDYGNWNVIVIGIVSSYGCVCSLNCLPKSLI